VLTRLAVATVFVCIVILLASACGWGGGSLARSPLVHYQDFVLYQTAPGDPPRIIGYGSMGGTLAAINTSFNLFNTSCPGRRPNEFHAQGLADAGFVNLSVPIDEWVSLTLSGPVRRLPHDEWAPNFPFTGILTPLAACAGSETIHIEGRPGPDLHHHWLGRVPDVPYPRNSIVLNLNQVRPTDRAAGALWGELFFNLNVIPPCPRYGSFVLPLDPTPPSSPRTFLMTDGSLLTVSGVPSTLDPDPPASLAVSLTFTGGACDAKSFTATLNN
jgi:hypothetical protein